MPFEKILYGNLKNDEKLSLYVKFRYDFNISKVTILNDIYVCSDKNGYTRSIYDKNFKFVCRYDISEPILIVNEYTVIKTSEYNALAFKDGKLCDGTVHVQCQLNAVVIANLFVFNGKIYEVAEKYVSKQENNYYLYIKSKNGETLVLAADYNRWKELDYKLPDVMDDEVFDKFIALELEKQNLEKQLIKKQIAEMENTTYDPHNVDYFIKKLEFKTGKPINEKQKAFLISICGTSGIVEKYRDEILGVARLMV